MTAKGQKPAFGMAIGDFRIPLKADIAIPNLIGRILVELGNLLALFAELPGDLP